MLRNTNVPEIPEGEDGAGLTPSKYGASLHCLSEGIPIKDRIPQG
jgi:hypothetical protein